LDREFEGSRGGYGATKVVQVLEYVCKNGKNKNYSMEMKCVIKETTENHVEQVAIRYISMHL
jgi:hypothetical protein